MMTASHSLVPSQYAQKDPRQLFYHFPSMPPVKLAKLMNKFYFYKALESVEQAAVKLGFVLIPLQCLTWKRAQKFAEDRKVKVVGRSFFMMRTEELTKTEREKLKVYLDEEVNSREAS